MDVRMSVQNLMGIPLFDGLDTEEVGDVLSRVNVLVKRFRKSDYILLAGDNVENLCIVITGTVQMIKEDIWGDKSIIANLGAGSIFAESYLGRRHDRSIVSYFAASDSEVLMLPFGRLLDNPANNKAHNKLMCNIVAILADNNSKLIEKTEILCKKTLRGKILAYLEHEANEAHSKKFVVPFSRTDLANYLDADRSALTRELARMRDEGIVNFEKNTFELLV